MVSKVVVAIMLSKVIVAKCVSGYCNSVMKDAADRHADMDGQVKCS
jgi:hypothetical protein